MKNEHLRNARNERGFTQRQLANKVGVALVTLRKWEGGTRSPSSESRDRLCQIFGKTETELGLDDLPEEATPASSSLQERPTQGDENRKTMMRRVDTLWISGVLDHSLSQGTLIHLYVREQPDAILNPWAQSVQESNLPPQPLPASTHITQVYDDTDGAFLLLGEPGAGKTTLLLELTRDLLDRAEQDAYHPIPVVFNLSSWAQKRQSIQDWMIEELNSKYQVPHKLAEEWVAANQILPLLDGLDEVAQIHRKECIQTINAYRKEHGFLPMLVCSRASEYLDLNTPIALNKAIAILPLTFQQIERYIGKEGRRLDAVKTALKTDQSLREMVSTPLMLTIISQAFQNTPLDTLLSIDDPQQRRNLIFEKYIEVVLRRRGPKSRYSSEQTVRWLAWLAKGMQRHNQSEFYIERMQPDWLENTHTRQQYHLAVNRIVFGLIILGTAGVFALFRGDSFPNQPGLFYWLGGGNGSSVLGWMSAGLGSFLKGASSITIIFVIISVLVSVLSEIREFVPRSLELRRRAWKSFRYGCLVGVGSGVFSAILFSRMFSIDVAFGRGILITCFSLFIITLMVGLTASLKPNTLSSQHHTKGPFLSRIMDFIVFSICGAVGFTCLYALQSGGFNQTVVTNGCIVSFFLGLLFSAGNAAETLTLEPEIEPAETVAWSWQNVRQNLVGNIKKGMLLGGVIFIVVAIATASLSAFFYGITYGLPYGAVFGCITGFITSITSILTATLTGGWSSDVIADKRQFIRPNEGIHRSMHHALFAAGVFGLIGGVASGGISGAAFGIAGVAGWPILGAGFSIIFSALLALHFFVRSGGIAFISHYVLRWYLWRAKSLPFNAIPFLDYAAERILLRKVGGGSIFAHRLLLEYFADLN